MDFIICGEVMVRPSALVRVHGVAGETLPRTSRGHGPLGFLYRFDSMRVIFFPYLAETNGVDAGRDFRRRAFFLIDFARGWKLLVR